jgi:hypothetical protein
MLKKNLKNVWFMEIDILMYCNPNIFTGVLQGSPYAYCYHKPEHCSSAVLYVRDHSSLQGLLASLDSYSNGFMSEMYALDYHNKRNPNDTLFPLIHKCDVDYRFNSHYGTFYSFIFDGATIGQYLIGLDNGIIGQDKAEIIQKLEGHINIWDHGSFEWHTDNRGLSIPFYKSTIHSELLPIANMHIHSKNLVLAVSYSNYAVLIT